MAFVLYGHLITFVICAKWTGDIYYPHIKLSDCQRTCIFRVLCVAVIKNTVYHFVLILVFIIFIHIYTLIYTHKDIYSGLTHDFSDTRMIQGVFFSGF